MSIFTEWLIFKPGMKPMHCWFLEIDLVYNVYICVSTPEVSNNYWHDMVPIWLVKQIL